jgi:hypothetical protein
MRKRTKGTFAYLLARIATYSMASTEVDMPSVTVRLLESGKLECGVRLQTPWGQMEFYKACDDALGIFDSIRLTIAMAIEWVEKNKRVAV